MTTTQNTPAAAVLDGETPRAKIRDLTVTFSRRGVPVNSLRGIDLDVYPGEVLAVVGESGSGKSVMGLALLGLLAGDSFHPRCKERLDRCSVEEPMLYTIDGTARRVASCFLTEAPARAEAALTHPDELRRAVL